MHNSVTWGMLIVVYLFLGGVSAGAAILSGVSVVLNWNEKIRKAGAYLAPFPVMLGLLLLIFDLHRPFLFYQLLLNFNLSSVMSWGVIALFAFSPVTILAAWFQFKGGSKVIKKVLAYLSLILGLGVGAYTGMLLAAVSSNPVWGTALLPVLFTISAFSTGVCGTILIAGLLLKAKHSELGKLASVDLIAIAAELIVIFVMVIYWFTNAQGTIAAEAVLTGSYGLMFWFLVVLGGLLLPFMLLIYELKAHGKVPAYIPYASAAAALVGGFFLRYVIVYAGQNVFQLLAQY